MIEDIFKIEGSIAELWRSLLSDAARLWTAASPTERAQVLGIVLIVIAGAAFTAWGKPTSKKVEASDLEGPPARKGFAILALGSLGIVFGDLGTSPLYTFREAFLRVAQTNGEVRADDVFGIVSLIFWSLLLLVGIKNIVFLMQFDNQGEGGTLSLMSLAEKALRGRTAFTLALGMFGAAFFLGDAIVTPALSVLSAVEGLREIEPLERAGIGPFVLPIAIGVVIALFSVQHRGASRLGLLFGPIALLWFGWMGWLGAQLVSDTPQVLWALSPYPALAFVAEHKLLSLGVLALIFLAIAGAEALYASMGQFGRTPIRTVWWMIVLPALTLSYLGQGAYALEHLPSLNAEIAAEITQALREDRSPSFSFSPFFLLASDSQRLPLVLLAVALTVIASQAVISGTFALMSQAIQMGLLPRMEVRRTSRHSATQIYMPHVNLLLLIGVVGLMLVFHSSGALTGAYGVAIAGMMLVDTIMMYLVLRHLREKPRLSLITLGGALIGPFLLLDLLFVGANLLKVLSGGLVTLFVASTVVLIFSTWVRGQKVMQGLKQNDLAMSDLLKTLDEHPPLRAKGMAVYFTRAAEVAPDAMMMGLKHFQVMHERVCIVTINSLRTPHASQNERIKLEWLRPDVCVLRLSFGFMEIPNVTKAFTEARKYGLKFDIMKTSFILSKTAPVPSSRAGMPYWQLSLFIFLSRLSISVTSYLHIPTGRVVELGRQTMMYVEEKEEGAV